MSFWKRLENRLSRWAIPNITTIIIAGQVMLYFGRQIMAAQNRGGDPLSKIYLIPSKVMEGEVWRLFSFPFTPPNTNLFFAFFGWYLFYLFGTLLEQQWGTTRYNIFLGIGCIANVAAGFIAYTQGFDTLVNNYFLYGTVFLAFARLNPTFIINVMFILPIQIKWLALLAWLRYAYGLMTGGWMEQMLVVASITNYLLFFGRDHFRELKQGQRRRSYQGKVKEATRKFEHVCVVCGLNSKDSPKTLFRYCSKCSGQQCYCPDHIHNHVCIVEESKELEDPALTDSS